VPAKRVPKLLPIKAGSRVDAHRKAADPKQQAKIDFAMSLAKLRMSRPPHWCCIGSSYTSAKDIHDWLNAHHASPFEVFPEWNWHVVKGHEAKESYLPINLPDPKNPGKLISSVLYAPGFPEAIAVIDYHPNSGYDAATWKQHGDGHFEYWHHWGESWVDVLGDALHDVDSVVSEVSNAVNEAIKYIQIAVSIVPILGQAVNEIIAGCEVVIDFVEGKTALQIALDAAYQAALAALPGLEVARIFLDPAEDFLLQIAGGARPGRAAIHLAVAKVPDKPNINGTTPQSLVASLLVWLLHKLNVKELGV
jgi:hypothetical protein